MEENELHLLWDRYISKRDNEDKNQLVTHYLPLVKAAAGRIAYGLPSHVKVDELVSAGVCGLLSSIEKFDPHTGFQFKTFASMRIHGAILDELRNMDWVPRSVRARAKKLQAAYNAVQQQQGRFAMDTEVAEFLGISMEELSDYIESTKIITLVSLDSKIYTSKSENPVNFSDLIEDKSDHGPSKDLFKQEQKEILVKAIEELSKQEKAVLTLYYFEELTLREIGEVLGVSESRVSQIHSKAIYRLKARLNFSEVSENAST